MSVPAVSIVDQVSASMSLRSLQHQVIASNIANRDTQGYQRLRLTFDGALEQMSSAHVSADTTRAPVSLEQDMVAMSSNSAQYQALARVLSRYFSIIATITGQGRG
ncbi:MAG TPA: flagellar basal body protein [Steroidobacteraceae bacterium]|nr:flagellar basal body protein [Steroidobacteraceae bacterium]